jgi:hypothetical protein
MASIESKNSDYLDLSLFFFQTFSFNFICVFNNDKTPNQNKTKNSFKLELQLLSIDNKLNNILYTVSKIKRSIILLGLLFFNRDREMTNNR